MSNQRVGKSRWKNVASVRTKNSIFQKKKRTKNSSGYSSCPICSPASKPRVHNVKDLHDYFPAIHRINNNFAWYFCVCILILIYIHLKKKAFYGLLGSTTSWDRKKHKIQSCPLVDDKTSANSTLYRGHARLWLHVRASLRNTDVSMLCFPGSVPKYSNTARFFRWCFSTNKLARFAFLKTFLKKICPNTSWIVIKVYRVNFQKLTCTACVYWRGPCHRLSRKDHGVEHPSVKRLGLYQ